MRTFIYVAIMATFLPLFAMISLFFGVNLGVIFWVFVFGALLVVGYKVESFLRISLQEKTSGGGHD